MAKNDVVVKITQKQVVGNAGFGIPLIVQGMGNETKAYTEVKSLEAVVEAGITTDSPIYRQCEKLFGQKNCPEKIAICVGTGKVTDTLSQIKEKDFRQVIPVLGSGEGDAADDTLAELAKYIEATEDKMLFVKVEDSSELEKIGKMDRTMVIVYTGSDEGVEGALVGATAGRVVGSFTYKNIILRGIEPDPLTDSQIDAIHKAGGISIVRKAGDVVTSEGKVTSGEFADIIDSKDYIIKNIAYKSQKLLNSSPKLAFDNTGISQLEGVVTNVLKEASMMQIIAVDEEGIPLYSTSFATRADTSELDRAARNYKGGKFSFELAGAIHYATINGTIEL